MIQKKLNSTTLGQRHSSDGGFTLVELIVVMLIIAVVFGLFSFRSSGFAYWQREASLRQLSETISFLHHRAISDRVYYKLEFTIPIDGAHSYRIGEILPTKGDTDELTSLASANAGSLSLLLADYLTPSRGAFDNMIPPRSFPSMAKPVYLPEELYFEDIQTPRGLSTPNSLIDDELPFILFSPRGFSEFSVLHLAYGEDGEGKATILVNPFTGITSIYREYREFEWTLDRAGGDDS